MTALRLRLIDLLEEAALEAARQVKAGLLRQSELASVLMWLKAVKGAAR